MLSYKQVEPSSITKIVCPKCREKVQNVGLLDGSKIEGLTFRCKKCRSIWMLSCDVNIRSPKNEN